MVFNTYLRIDLGLDSIPPPSLEESGTLQDQPGLQIIAYSSQLRVNPSIAEWSERISKVLTYAQ